jgi:hypothetical protein
MFHHSWPQNQDLWNLYHKVTFDGPNRRIIVNDGELSVNIKEDVYSAWKEWAKERDYLKFLPACRSVGGDPTVEGNFLGSTFFTINDWQILIREGTTFVGNIFSDDFSSPFTTDPNVDLAQSQVSNLIDAISINTSELVEAGIATTGTISEQTTTLQNTIPTGVVDELNNTTYDGVPYEDIMAILLSMAQGRIVESSSGVFEFYAQNNTGVLYTLTKSGNERNRS